MGNLNFIKLASLVLWQLSLSCVTHAYTDQWTSVRALGMGKAYSAVVTDSDALFYNPASLGRISNFSWTLFDPRVGANGTGALDAARQFNSDKNNSTSLSNFLNGQYGKTYWTGGGAKTALSMPGLGAAFFGNADLQIAMSNPPYPALDLNYFVDYGAVVGGAVPLDDGGLTSLGIVAKRINRTGTSQPLHATIFSSLDYNTVVDDIKNNGIGYGVDAGFNFAIPSPIHPVLSIVYHDIGMTSFSHEGGPAAPEPIAPNLVIGSALEFSLPLMTITPALDVEHVDDPTQSLGKKIHVGVEIALPVFDFRGGFNQGYYTLGAGLSFGFIRFDAVTYGEELGAYAGQKEDRRYMAQMTLALSLPLPKFAHKSNANDPDSADGAAERRDRLKERR